MDRLDPKVAMFGVLAMQFGFQDSDGLSDWIKAWQQRGSLSLDSFLKVGQDQKHVSGESIKLLKDVYGGIESHFQGDIQGALSAFSKNNEIEKLLRETPIKEEPETPVDEFATLRPDVDLKSAMANSTSNPTKHDSGKGDGSSSSGSDIKNETIDPMDLKSKAADTKVESVTPAEEQETLDPFGTLVGTSAETKITPNSNETISDSGSKSKSAVDSLLQDNSPRYLLQKLHAKGGLGQVSVASEPSINRIVALKEIQPQFADEQISRDRFLKEAQITGQLEHPGIVPIYGIGCYADGRPYYAMRFIEGNSLKEAVDEYHEFRESPESDEDEIARRLRKILARFATVCYAIDYAHSRGVIHRDLKPDNIMLGPYGESLVVDWGLAKLQDQEEVESETASVELQHDADTSKTLEGNIVGTPAYMSPEQASGNLASIAQPADIYSLGATLYYILVGAHPIRGKLMEVLQRVRDGDIKSPHEIRSTIPRSLSAVTEKAMNVKISGRYRTATELAEEVERFIADEPVLACPEPFSVRARRWMKKHRAIVSSVAASLVVAIIGLTVGVLLLSASNQREIQSRTEAQRSFEMAREAIDDQFVLVSENVLLKRPGLQKLRESLLEKSVTYYERFLQRTEVQPDLLQDLAKTNFYIGKVKHELSDFENANRYYKRSLQLYEQLDVENPDDLEIVKAIGNITNAIGNSLENDGQDLESQEQFAKAIEIRKRALDLAKAESVADQEFRRLLANSYMNLGVVERNLKNYDSAQKNMETAQKIRMEIENRNSKIEQDIGRGYFNISETHEVLKDPDQQRKNQELAIEYFEKVGDGEESSFRNRDLLATCYFEVGVFELKAEQFDEAMKFFELALPIRRQIAMENRMVPRYQLSLARLLIQLVVTNDGELPQFERLTEARKILEKLVRQDDDNQAYLEELAKVHEMLALSFGNFDMWDNAIKFAKLSKSNLEALLNLREDDAEIATRIEGIDKLLKQLIKLKAEQNPPRI